MVDRATQSALFIVSGGILGFSHDIIVSSLHFLGRLLPFYESSIQLLAHQNILRMCKSYKIYRHFVILHPDFEEVTSPKATEALQSRLYQILFTIPLPR